MPLLVFLDWSFDAPPNSGRGFVYLEILMATGTVKFFNPTKGFGFIAPQDGSKDIFVHISAVERAGMQSLTENQQVTFDAERGTEGRFSAINLKAA